jgi:ribosomal peptide maturation radical SAM protein 1
MKMDALPLPDFRDYFYAYHSLALEQAFKAFLPVETSRGCWWGERSQCLFCGLNGMTIAYRSKSAAKVLEEFVSQSQRYGVSRFQAVDNILNLDFFKSVFPELIRRKIELNIFFETKANLKKNQVLLLKEAGVESIQPGIESLSDEILKLMRKGVTGLQNIMLLKYCREAGIGVAWNWLWGFPNEREEEYQRIARWVPLLHHLAPPSGFGRIHLDRFSPLFELWERYGLANVQPNFAYRSLYPIDRETLRDLAYYFDYDYVDGRNPETYTKGLAKELTNWMKISESQDHPILAMLDLQSCITVYDTRRCAVEKIHVLSDLEAELYRQTTCVRDYGLLLKSCLDSGFQSSAVEEALRSLSDRKLLLIDGGRCLALACDMTQQESDKTEWSELTENWPMKVREGLEANPEAPAPIQLQTQS